MIYLNRYSSPLGPITMTSDGQTITGLWFSHQKEFNDNVTNKHKFMTLQIFGETNRWLDLYFQGIEPQFMPRLSFQTTDFRKEVWNILLKIPFGQITTYGQIAHLVKERRGLSKMSAQAVGGAVSHNNILILIPCHRVVGANGNLTGYSGGMDKKIKLLQIEHVDLKQFCHSPNNE